MLKRAKKGLPPIAILILGYLGVILAGTGLLLLPISVRSGISFADALFTATSAVCVTGLSVVDLLSKFTGFGQFVLLCLIQTGGLGFMTIATLAFVLLGKRVSLKHRLVISEAMNTEEIRGLVKLVKRFALLSFCIEFTGALLILPSFLTLFSVGEAVWKALFHAVSAYCNAGFDLLGTQSVTVFAAAPWFNVVTATLILLGGLGAGTVLEVLKKRKFRILSVNAKIVLISSLVLVLTGTVFFFTAEYANTATFGTLTFGQKLAAALLQSVTPRTAGFAAVNQAELTPSSRIFTMLLMFIGAGPASTGGGIKVTTFFVLLCMVWASIRGNQRVVVSQREVAQKTLFKTVALIFAYVFLIVSALFVLHLTEAERFSSEQLLFECISALSTVGLSMGITAQFSVGGKFVLMLLMFLGRVGFLSFALAIAGKDNNLPMKYPEAKISVG